MPVQVPHRGARPVGSMTPFVHLVVPGNPVPKARPRVGMHKNVYTPTDRDIPSRSEDTRCLGHVAPIGSGQPTTPDSQVGCRLDSHFCDERSLLVVTLARVTGSLPGGVQQRSLYRHARIHSPQHSIAGLVELASHLVLPQFWPQLLCVLHFGGSHSTWLGNDLCHCAGSMSDTHSLDKGLVYLLQRIGHSLQRVRLYLAPVPLRNCTTAARMRTR